MTPPLQKYRYQHEVAADIATILPLDVRSILDVGCGEGYVLSHLPRSVLGVGVDRDLRSLRSCDRNKFLSDLLSLPFGDGSFDLVMANDVLEHLSGDERQGATAELARVARKYLCVTVPFQEDLNVGSTQCENCRRYYHVNHHQSSFGVEDLERLFEKHGWHCVLQILSGDQWQSQPDEIVWLKRMLSLELAHDDRANCPNCGSRRQVKGSGDTTLLRMLDGIAARIYLENTALGDSRYLRTECISLYSKNSDGAMLFEDGPFLDRHGKSTVLPGQTLQTNQVIFTSPGLYRQQSFPISSPLPYFVSDKVDAHGARVEKGSTLSVGFFIAKSLEPNAELRLQGRTSRAGLTICPYDTYFGSSRGVQTTVSGCFNVNLTVPGTTVSRYGVVFQISTDDEPILLEEIRLLNGDCAGRSIYDNANGRARFLRLSPDRPLFLSLPLYGEHLVELEWMRAFDNRALSRDSYRSLPLDVGTALSLQKVTDALKQESSTLTETLLRVVKERFTAENAYEHTLGRKLSRRFAKVWTAVRAAMGL